MASPRYVVVNIGPHLKNLRAEIKKPQYPHIDLDAILDQVVDAIYHRDTSEWELNDLPIRLLKEEIITSHAPSDRPSHLDDFASEEDQWENVLGLEVVASRAAKLGYALQSTLDENRIFVDGYLQFEYGGILDETSIVLRGRR